MSPLQVSYFYFPDSSSFRYGIELHKRNEGWASRTPLPRYRDKLDIADKVLYVRYFSPEMFSLVEMIVFVPLAPVVKFIACWLSS